MKPLKPLLFALAAMSLNTAASAQKGKKVDVTFEEVKHTCDSVPLDQRTHVSVTRFNVTTTQAPPELGANMATMLENALQQMNCFLVLESLDNLDDMTKETNASGAMDPSKVQRSGKMLGAQAVFTGEITEYNTSSNKTTVLGVNAGGDRVRLGFILKILDPSSRGILWSQSINVEGKAGGSGGMGFGIPLIGRINLANSVKSNPALANALEKGILESCSLLSKNIRNIPLPKPGEASSITELTVKNTDFDGNDALDALVKASAGVSRTEPAFAGGTGTIVVYHKGTTNELWKALKPTVGAKYAVAELADGKLVLTAK